jgi:secernin
MDLLRLALERAKTARQAVDVITELLERYGQNANASQLFDRRYENSFLLVDPEDAWLLETAGRHWVAKQVEDRTAISNCYSIGTEYDLCSPELESHARSQRWLAPTEKLNFAKAYTAPAIRQTMATPRWRRLCTLIGSKELLTESDCRMILRDHFQGQLLSPRFGAAYGMFVSICMHAMTWDASQTTCSMLCWWDPLLGVVGRYAPSIPCCSVYLPVYMAQLPGCMTRGGEKFDPESLWWQTERLAMAVSIDEERFGAEVRSRLREFETEVCDSTRAMERSAKDMMEKGHGLLAKACLMDLTAECAEDMLKLVTRLADHICTEVAALGGLYGPRKEFLESYCARTGLPL